VRKLASAFEIQFFKHFDQTNQVKSDGERVTYQGDRLTVTTSRQQYNNSKQKVADARRQVEIKKY
jgi:hypothetical protein